MPPISQPNGKACASHGVAFYGFDISASYFESRRGADDLRDRSIGFSRPHNPDDRPAGDRLIKTVRAMAGPAATTSPHGQLAPDLVDIGSML
jgi:hypothetical protein